MNLTALRFARVVGNSLRSRREWVPARTSVPNASAKSRAGREKNGEESSSATLRRKTFRALTHSRQLRRLGRKIPYRSWVSSDETFSEKEVLNETENISRVFIKF